QIDHCGALGVQKLATESLVVLRAALDRAVVRLVEAGGEPVLPEAIGAPQALRGVLADPVLAYELVEAHERSVRGVQPRLDLLLRRAAVLLQAEQADQE